MPRACSAQFASAPKAPPDAVGSEYIHIKGLLSSPRALVLQAMCGTAPDLADVCHDAPSHGAWGSFLPVGAADGVVLLVDRSLCALCFRRCGWVWLCGLS